MVTSDQLEESKAIQRRTGRTFHVATRFLPRRARHPTYVLYAFFRLADDVVDDPDPPPADERRAELAAMRAAVLDGEATDEPVLAAMADLRERHGIPDREVEVFLDAMVADVEATDYETYADLERYLRGSSVAVANMMLDVMDPADPEAARPHARALAEAFQLTNFLRDVREDVRDYDRVYLPRETLTAHGVAREEITRLEYSPRFAAAMRTELERTEARYREGVAGIGLLPEDCQFPVLLAAVLYAEHHRRLRARDFDVLSARPSLRRRDYARVVARTWWHWRRTRDPEAVFYRVGAVPRRADDPAPSRGPLASSVGRVTDRLPLVGRPE